MEKCPPTNHAIDTHSWRSRSRHVEDAFEALQCSATAASPYDVLVFRMNALYICPLRIRFLELLSLFSFSSRLQRQICIDSRESSSITFHSPLCSCSPLTGPSCLKRFQGLSRHSKALSSQRQEDEHREAECMDDSHRQGHTASTSKSKQPVKVSKRIVIQASR